MKRGKRGQFYLIAAAIIIFILVGFALISNYVSVKKTPQKFYDIGDVLKREGANVITYSINTQQDVNTNIQTYLSLYKQYLEKNLNSDFNLVIFYGNINSSSRSIAAQIFTRASLGEITLVFGGHQTFRTGGSQVQINKTEWSVQQNVNGNTANITLYSNRTGATQSIIVPLLQDNNFAFVMTSNDEFNNYVQQSFLNNQAGGNPIPVINPDD
jgi:hypothetical protein